MIHTAEMVSRLRAENNWKRYFVMWLLINLSVWSIGLLYLKFKSPTYTSSWTINLPGAGSSADIELPEVGRATSSNESLYNSQSIDPRENYAELAKTDEVLERAAVQLDIPVEEFGSPQIKTVDNTTLMKFEIKGDTPEDAQKKAFALHKALETKLNNLRKEELAQQDVNLEAIVPFAEKKLQAAQQRLSEYQIRSGLSSSDQLGELSTNIEQLRRQRAEAVAQLKRTSAQLKHASVNLDLSPQQAAEALVLQSDLLFQRLLANYSEASAALVTLSTNFSTFHPAVVNKRSERDKAQAALYQRGQSLLGKPITQTTLKQLNINDSSSSESQRASLFQDLISLQGEQRGRQAESQELAQQIAQLESKHTTLAQKRSTLVDLERDVKRAEAIFSSALTKSDLSKSNTSAAYPQIFIFTKPNLPTEPSSPKYKFVVLGMILFFLFSTAGMTSLWLRGRKIQQASFDRSIQITHQLDNLDSIPRKK